MEHRLLNWLVATSRTWARNVKEPRGLKTFGTNAHKHAIAQRMKRRIGDWADAICSFWEERRQDGCSKLLTEYEIHIEAIATRDGFRRLNQVKTKLGSYLQGPNVIPSEHCDGEQCRTAVRMLLSQLNGLNERDFLAGVDEIIDEWKRMYG